MCLFVDTAIVVPQEQDCMQQNQICWMVGDVRFNVLGLPRNWFLLTLVTNASLTEWVFQPELAILLQSQSDVS